MSLVTSIEELSISRGKTFLVKKRLDPDKVTDFTVPTVVKSAFLFLFGFGRTSLPTWQQGQPQLFTKIKVCCSSWLWEVS